MKRALTEMLGGEVLTEGNLWYDVLQKAQNGFVKAVVRELKGPMKPATVKQVGDMSATIKTPGGEVKLILGFKGGSIGEFFFALPGKDQILVTAVSHNPKSLAKVGAEQIKQALEL